MKTVITYGTFDLFHQGHYNILKRAKELGDYLIVGVTGETYDAERGKLSVQDSLATRIENVRKTGFADKIIVEEYLGQKIPDIMKYHVDIFAIGSDWKGKFDHIGKYCQIVYLERTKDISSTLLRAQNLSIYRLGIVTDSVSDDDIIQEAQCVSGIHVESVFSPQEETARAFAKKYELHSYYTDYVRFLDSVDIVCIKIPKDQRKKYVDTAIDKGIHVICDMPYTLDASEEQKILQKASEKNVVFFSNVLTIYQHAFGQLLWMARGNLIGDLVSIKCSLSKTMFAGEDRHTFLDFVYYITCAIVKILGTEYQEISAKLIHKNDGTVNYGMLNFYYENALANAEISMEMETECGMRIIGTEGEMYIPEDWWRVGYFTLKNKSDERPKRYSSNFEGNGFRYLIQALLHDIRTGNTEFTLITSEEYNTITAILSTLSQKYNLK